MTDTPDPDRILSAAALAALPFGIWVWDPERRLVFANAAAWRLAGVDAAELPLGTPFRDAARLLAYRGSYGPGDPAAQLAQHLGLDRTRPLRRMLHRTDGTCHELHSIPLPGGGFCSVVAELTGYIAATEEANALVRRLETVLTNLHAGLALYDAERRLVLSNPAYEDLIGLPRSTVHPGMTQREVLEHLARRGEIADAEPDRITAEGRRLDRSALCGWQRERPNGQVVLYASQPMPGGGYMMEVTDITAARRAEDEARRRAALLDGVLASLPHGVVVYGPDQRVAMVNAAHQALLAGSEVAVGEHREEIARRRAHAGEYGPGDPEALMREHLPALAGSHPARHQRARPDGTVLDIHYAALPDGGRVQVTTDITALHRARAEATGRAALLQVMLDNMRHGIALFDAGHRLVASNALAARLMGLAPDRLWPGRGIGDIIEEQGAKGEFGAIPVAEVIRNAGSRDRTKPLHYTRTRPDGTVVEVISDPIPDGGFVCTYSDITARARAEAEARGQAATLQAMIDNLRHGAILYGPDRRVRVANALTSTLAGHPPGSVRPGRTLEELVAGMAEDGALGEGAQAEATRARILGADRSKSWHNIRTTRDGRVLEIHSDPMPDGGFIVSQVDITPLARAEAAARERAAMLQSMLDNTRHGIALYGPDRRLLVANTLAAGLSFLREEITPGRSLEEMIRLQLERGFFGTGEAALALAEQALRVDRSRPERKQRTMPDGRVLEIASDPTPDGGFVVTWSDITALARAEEAAQRRAAMLQATMDSMRHAIVMYGPDRRLLTANRLAGPDYGLPTLESRVGEPFDDLVAEQRAAGIFGPEPQGAEIAAWITDLDRSRPIRYQRRLGNGRIIEVASDPTPDGGFVITHSDVTELVEAKADASRRAATLQAMLDNTRHGISHFGPDRRMIATNALSAELAGHSPDLARIGMTLDELIRDQHAQGALGTGERARALMQAALSLDRSKPSRIIRSSGDGRILEVTSDPTPDGGFVITHTDITQLARAQQEASQRATMLQAMLDNIRHGIALFDDQDRVVAVNPVFRQLLDLPEEVLAPGRPYTDFVDLLWERGEYGEGETGLATTTVIKTRDRRKTIRSVRTRPNGVVLEIVSDPTPDGGWVLTYTDVTEDRRIRAELERAKEAAEAANRAKSRFLATMSHELRTPLNAVIGFSEAIMADPDPERGQDYLRSIHEAGRHLLSLIDDILDVTRAETTGFQVSEGEADVLALAEGSIRVMRATAAAAQVTLATELPPALPLVRADEVRLRQVLLNLLSNAVKFTPAGGVVTLVAKVDPVGDLVLRVSDTGIGIPPEEIPRAFEPFTQLDGSLSRRFPGSGLGLYLSRALAEAQGAELTLESAPGAGTTAVLRIPKSRLLAPVAA